MDALSRKPTTAREGIAVLVRPELVVEIALDCVHTSTRYPGGLALRFARVKRSRPDKRAEERTRSTTCARAHRHQGVMPDLLYGTGAPSPRKVLPPKAEGLTIRHMCLDGPSRRIISEPIQPAVVLPAQPSEPEPRPEPRKPGHQPEPEPAARS